MMVPMITVVVAGALQSSVPTARFWTPFTETQLREMVEVVKADLVMTRGLPVNV